MIRQSIWWVFSFEPPHNKTKKKKKKWHVRPAKTQISLGISTDWSESSLSGWRKLGSLATHLTHGEDSDQTGRMPRLIWVLAGRTATLLVLSLGGSFALPNSINVIVNHFNIDKYLVIRQCLKSCKWKMFMIPFELTLIYWHYVTSSFSLLKTRKFTVLI